MLLAGIPYPTERPPKFTLDKGVVTLGEGGEKDEYSVALSILIPLGEYFQVQDDFLDFSAPPEVLGKIGTDIVDNKCSWVVNTALALTSPSSSSSSSPPNPFNPSLTPTRLAELRSVLESNYGRKDAEKEKKVKEVFEELGIRKAYEAYEERVVGEVRERIGKVEEREGGLKREVFESFLGKIYKRKQEEEWGKGDRKRGG
ncbi:hypothetical protein NMY22_g2069 [Coprinellus aureogranulatus]|nr:hypothetical protein NMY22_g2069 [Coprinellus aureogranulatus]